MYCSSCGTAVAPGLSYCPRCGAGLRAQERSVPDPPEEPPEHLIWAIVAVSVGGLGVIIGLMALMKEELHFSTELILLFSLLSFLLLLGAEGIFIWLLWRWQKATKAGREITREKGLTTRELEAAQAPALPEPPLGVTEHTTRTLEPALRKHKTE